MNFRGNWKMGFVTGKPFVDIIIGTNIFLECNHKEFLSWKILSVCVRHTKIYRIS
jgi:hypothetical protein